MSSSAKRSVGAGAKSNIVIVPARPSDAAAAVRITVEAFDGVSIDQAIERRLGRAGGKSWRKLKGDAVREEFRRAPEQCFVARAGRRVVGYITTEISKPRSRGRIPNLAVAASCRGQGIGRRLIEHALAHFRRLGLRQARIETLAVNEAGLHLYPAMGFEEVARQVYYVMPLAPKGRE